MMKQIQNSEDKFPWLWDAEMSNAEFIEILGGRRELDGRDWKWAMARLIEYAPYAEIRRLLPERLFLERWAEVAPLIKSPSTREGCDFLREYLLRRAA